MKNGDAVREKSNLSVQYPRKLSVTALPLSRYVCMASSGFARQSPGKFFSLECFNYTQLFLCSRRSFTVETSLYSCCNDRLSPDICFFYVAIAMMY